MWMFFGLLAIGTTLWGLCCVMRGKHGTVWAMVGMALTALTLCTEYQILATWAESNDWGAILDVAPTMGSALWILTSISVVLNLGTVLLEKKMQRVDK